MNSDNLNRFVRRRKYIFLLLIFFGFFVLFKYYLSIQNNQSEHYPPINSRELEDTSAVGNEDSLIKQVLTLLSREKYTEAFKQINNSKDIVLVYLKSVMQDKGYGTAVNFNVHEGRIWRDLKKMERMRKYHPDAADAIYLKYSPFISFIEKKAHDGDLVFQILIAYLTRTGIGVPQNKVKAAEWYQSTIEQHGDPLAMCELGRMYTSPISGIKQNNKKARALFEKAAMNGYPQGETWLGEITLEENGINEETIKYYNKQKLKAAEKGDVGALGYMSNIYMFGNFGVKINYEKAYMWKYLEWLNGIHTDKASYKSAFTRDADLKRLERLINLKNSNVEKIVGNAISEAKKRFKNQEQYLHQKKN